VAPSELRGIVSDDLASKLTVVFGVLEGNDLPNVAQKLPEAR
jgi:hypothetical protein